MNKFIESIIGPCFDACYIVRDCLEYGSNLTQFEFVDDREEICASLCLLRSLYHGVGIVIFVIGLCLLPFIPHIIHGYVPPDINIYVLFLIYNIKG